MHSQIENTHFILKAGKNTIYKIYDRQYVKLYL